MAKLISQQILVPKKVYIGDTAELRCTFSTNSTILKQLTTNGVANISTESFDKIINSKEFEIKQVQISPAGVDYYQLVITFVPWKTGAIQFPSLEFGDDFIDFEPVSIVSIIEQSNATSIKENMAPLLLPGTTYKIYGAIIGLIIILIVGIRLIVKRKSIAFFLKNKKLQRKYRKNKRRAIRELKNLRNTDCPDSQVASSIQNIMRNYLEIRWDYPFTRAATSELMASYSNATGRLLSDAKEEAFGDIVSIFIRTDYVRYSASNSFKTDEKSSLLERLINNIEIMEGTDNA